MANISCYPLDKLKNLNIISIMIKNFNKQYLIFCENLIKIYKEKNKEVKALDNITIGIKTGEIVGLLGPNGAGKTTLIKCLCRLINPSSGNIFIDGVDAIKKPNFAFEKIAAVLEGNRNVYWRMSTRENLELFAGLMGYNKKAIKNQVEELVEVFGLKDKIDTEARFLSRGMQQKLAVACALIKNTEILLLDEPTLGLDVETTREVKELLKKNIADNRKTILLSSHNMSVIEDVCGRVIIINQGRVVADEEVRRLKEFFKVNTYQFEVEGSIKREFESEFSGRFLGCKFSLDGKRVTIEINMRDSLEIYDVLELLKRHNIKLLGIQKIEPDFEEIYLRLVQNEKK